MAYGDDEKKKRSPLAIIGGVLAFAAAYGGAKSIVNGGWNFYNNSPARFEANFEEAVTSNPAMASTYGAMKEYFPEDYAGFKADMQRRVSDGATNEEMKAASHAYMRAFTSRHNIDVAHAPSAYLKEFRVTQREVVEKLATESAELCAHFGITGLLPTDRPSKNAQSIIANAARQQIRTAGEGMRKPVMRDTKTITDADSIAFVDAMVKGGLAESEVDLISDSKELSQASAEQQCRVSRAIYNAMNSLPEAQADRVTAIIVSSS